MAVGFTAWSQDGGTSWFMSRSVMCRILFAWDYNLVVDGYLLITFFHHLNRLLLRGEHGAVVHRS